MLFENLKKLYLEDRETQKELNRFYIDHGFLQSWNEAEKKESDNGLKRYATETRWNAYQAGKISREKCIEYTVKRMEKQLEKETAGKLEKLERIATAPDLVFASVNLEFKRGSVYGTTVYCYSRTNNGYTEGRAGGYGYDKESAAVADAFNKNDSVLKILYTLKEKALEAGLSDFSETACTRHDNRNIIGYGSGYTVLPYFEGGVGVNCFWEILKKAGYTVRCNYGKSENFYDVCKA